MEPVERAEEVGEVRKPRPAWAHPVASGFHVGFKLAGVMAYEMIYYWTADFWTTKNVSGRLLVGLRWWNEVREDGKDVWIFESLEDKSRLDSKEFWVFWVALLLFPVVWCFLAVGALFSFLKLEPQWVVICIIVLAMYGANIIGYWKCSRDAKNRVSKYAQSTASSYITSSLIPAFLASQQEGKEEDPANKV